MKWEWCVIALLVALVAGNAVMTWALWPDRCPVGAPKYRLRDFPQVPPSQPVNLYGHEAKRWAFRCVSPEAKDCDRAAIAIPEPGTLLLAIAGLIPLLGWRP
jgi:hypothetical protein